MCEFRSVFDLQCVTSYRFPYLGIIFCGDGDTLRNWETRRARASTRFFELANIWNDTSLSTETKLSLYRSLVVSVLIYGYEAWMLDAKFIRSINTFNSRCLARIVIIRRSVCKFRSVFDLATL